MSTVCRTNAKLLAEIVGSDGCFFFCSLALVVAVVVSSISEPSHFQWQVRVVWRFFHLGLGARVTNRRIVMSTHSVCVFFVCAVFAMSRTRDTIQKSDRTILPHLQLAGWLAGCDLVLIWYVLPSIKGDRALI